MLLFLGDFMKITFFDTIPSTNLYLKENYQKLDNLEAVVAKHQTAGRGRTGRSWKDSEGLLMSILIKENIIPKYVESLSLLVCASIFKALKKYTSDIIIKWPNDILINSKKVCGILLESVVKEKIECIVIGFGININDSKFDEDIENKATSLFLETGTRNNINNLANEIYEIFLIDYENFLNGSNECFNICKNNSCLINKKVVYNTFGNEEEAVVRDILQNGHILLETKDGLLERSSGEITFHYNYYNDKQSD